MQGPSRTSNMLAPIMLLTGHEAEIFSAKFSPDGEMVASGGFDRLICKLFLSHICHLQSNNLYDIYPAII